MGGLVLRLSALGLRSFEAHALHLVSRVKPTATEPILRAARIARACGLSLLIVGSRVIQAQDGMLLASNHAAAVAPHRDSVTFRLPTTEIWAEAAVHAPVLNGSGPRDRSFLIVGIEREYPLVQGP